MTKIFQKLYNDPKCDYNISWDSFDPKEERILSYSVGASAWFKHVSTDICEFMPELFFNYITAKLEEDIKCTTRTHILNI